MALITLTSDIGYPDYLVGAIKAQLLRINPEFRIIDISHHISPFDYPQAAYICRSAIKNFPDYSFHLILVNLFEKKNTQLLLVYHHKQYLLCADNGLISMILEESPELVIGIPLKPGDTQNALTLTRVMGETVNQLQQGVSLQQIGIPDAEYLEKKHLKPVVEPHYIEGQIIFIDRFENVIVNITKEQFEQQRKGRNFKIVFTRGETINKISENYSDVPEGEKLAFFNSAGYLEIAINKGNAAGLFGLKSFSERIREGQLSYRTVKIYFE
ncbi:MAG: SAM-dependent chlorinase/fluorinase [Chitinophagaceae bacterium]|nr:SAM-dependent chlorinase/fluorinase [Chitinophagaceae bacterium]